MLMSWAEADGTGAWQLRHMLEKLGNQRCV